ncbi:MAG: SUMF1/EgtB/PvdO family nonheme iron enzyme, partial [Anaerolineales bacterium]|nr:SUMF1/EgtB/PvdO family nonheme iron enzyme [Anaerolineales bacterium]
FSVFGLNLTSTLIMKNYWFQIDLSIVNLVFDYFPEVADEFTTGMTKSQKVRELIGYAERHGVWDNLVAAVGKGAKVAVYQQFFNIAPQLPPTTAPSPQPRNPRQIFLSYATADVAIAQQVAAALAADGWRVWMAPDSVLPGELWVAAIERGLQESGVFLLLLSPEAVASRWVQYETNIAIALERRGKLDFVSLWLRPCEPPLTWEAYQWVVWQDGEYGRLRQRLNSTRSRGFQSSPPARPITLPTPAAAEAAGFGNPGYAEVLPATPQNYVDAKTGLEMIYIPPGPFLYGENKEKRELPGYWISKTPVTNAVYKRFLDANPQHLVPKAVLDVEKPYAWDEQERTFPAEKTDHPVVLVSWYDAMAFAEWVGMVLPTEEQWEKAARGIDGRDYPWGVWREGCANTRETGILGTTPVGRYSPQGDSPYGCVDMCGNVWDWTATQHELGGWVLRGGSWGDNHEFALLWNFSGYLADGSIEDIGFRLVAPVVSDSWLLAVEIL